ncbi:MAG: hypothetical protein LBH07_02700 [Treponema sp.]|jgi:hypothetical protein|nr:hypothetical protein [Treponema sp.]
MKWPIIPSKWLLLFLGGNEDDRRVIETHLPRAAAFAERNAPKYEVHVFDTSVTKNIPTGFTVENELIEEFIEKILDDLIKYKKRSGATKAALIIDRTAFPNEEIFEYIIKQVKHDDSIYHLICSRGDFLNIEQRKKCYKISCDKCIESLCRHSCLLRLLWVIFEDKRVLNVLDGWKG